MNLCIYIAVERIPLGIAVALEFIGPLTLAVALSRRRIDLLWVALAILGLALILPLSPTISQGLSPVGILFALIAAGLWAAYSLLGRRIGRQQGTSIITIAMAIAALLLLPLAATRSGAPTLTVHLAIMAVAMEIFSSALPLSLELFALSSMPTRVYGTFTSLEPAFGTLMGLLVLQELPSAQQLAGIAAIIIASLGSAVYSA